MFEIAVLIAIHSPFAFDRSHAEPPSAPIDPASDGDDGTDEPGPAAPLDTDVPEDDASTGSASADGSDRTDDASLRAKVERLEERLATVEDENEELRLDQELMREEQEQARQVQKQRDKFSVRVGGYVDAGFFWAQGDGSGVRPDLGHRFFPEYEDVPDVWVFAGDPLSTAVNSRGEAADTGGSQAIQFDSVDSRGNSTFLLNALNLQLFARLGDQFSAIGMVDFVPRTRDISMTEGQFLGDFVDVKLGLLRWDVPVKRFDFAIDVGKVDSVFGYEYRRQEAPYRVEVTPSVLCRYTCGRPVGLKTRMLFLDQALSVAASLTNGSSYQESYAFYNEVDRNHFKTAATRVAYEFDVGAGLEIGASGQYGAQDLQADDLVAQWQYGFDAHLDIRGFELMAEFVQGRAQGAGDDRDIPRCERARCLQVRGAYGTMAYRALNWLMPFVRVDWRDALHESGTDFVYVSNTVRVTPGARFEVSPHVVIKAQYVVNLEVGRVPRIPNDVFTTSMVGYF